MVQLINALDISIRHTYHFSFEMSEMPDFINIQKIHLQKRKQRENTNTRSWRGRLEKNKKKQKTKHNSKEKPKTQVDQNPKHLQLVVDHTDDKSRDGKPSITNKIFLINTI